MQQTLYCSVFEQDECDEHYQECIWAFKYDTTTFVYAPSCYNRVETEYFGCAGNTEEECLAVTDDIWGILVIGTVFINYAAFLNVKKL